MEGYNRTHNDGRPRQRRAWQRWFNIVIIFAFVLGAQAPLQASAVTAEPEAAGPAAPLAQTNTTHQISLNVFSARTEPKAFDGQGVNEGDPVTDYTFLINIDNTGDPNDTTNCNPFLDAQMTQRNPNYPDGCDWPSLRTVPGWAPIYIQGDQNTLNDTTTLTLPDGKYLISVSADGYKIDGEHFTIPAEDPDGDGVAALQVGVQPQPLPPATMVIQVYEDISMTNGQLDAPVEQGLPGFRASLNDIAGEITTDLFGNPLCTVYEKDANGEVRLDGDGAPIIESLGQGCYSDNEGIITIPNIGPLRYDVLIFPPTGEHWVQTTTLEGSQGWDTWLQEAGTGLDNEFLIASEPTPWTLFGFVRPNTPALGGTGTIRGEIIAAATFIPGVGGLPYQGTTFGGLLGTKEHRPIDRPWLSLNDFQNGDTSIWVGQGNADGTFEITNVPAGNYLLTYWDEKQHYILDWKQVTVDDGQVTDMGKRHLTGWFTEITGTVFHDTNSNGRRDPGETPVPHFTVVLRDRDNTEIDRMSIASVTGASGEYALEKAYPMGSWMVLEAYNDLYHTTGITYQTLNMPEEQTLLGPIVDIGILPILGQPVRVDWGVHRYDPTENGGIAGSVFYDTVRAEDDARFAGAEPWQPGIPELKIRLFQAQMNQYGEPIKAPDGSFAKGQLLGETITETFARPKGCTARDADGNPIDYAVLPLPEDGKDCVEGPLMGTQIGDGQNNLDGNWGFGEGCFGPGGYNPDTGACANGEDPTPLPSGHYLVEVDIPNDASGNPMFKVTREEDINTYDGDTFVPAIPPPACAGPLHTIDVADVGDDTYPSYSFNAGGVTVTVPESTPTVNPGYVEVGGSRFEGTAMPLCNVKHVYLSNSKSVAPIFTLFTDVPIPGKWKGYIIDNLNISTNPFELFFGEMAPVPNVPIGLYDFSGRLVETVHSDRNGVYEVLLPSTKTTNAPSPSGMLAGVYYLYGNDPGPIGRPNLDYNPQYRSIGTSFEIYPGTIVPSDLAPVQNGVSIWVPGSQFNNLAQCKLEDTTPKFYAVSKPYVTLPQDEAGRTIAIKGLHFGAEQGTGYVLLGNRTLPVNAWSDREISVTIPTNILYGPHQLTVTAGNGESTVNGITFHVLGGDIPTGFPSTSVLDNFNRSNGVLGPNWGGAGNTLSIFRVLNNQVQVRGTGSAWWLPATGGADQEAHFTFIRPGPVSSTQSLLVKFNGTNPSDAQASYIQANFNRSTSQVQVFTKTAGEAAVLQAAFPATMIGGDQLGVRALADGTVNVYKNGGLLGSVNVATSATPWPVALVQGGGRFGFHFSGAAAAPNDARFDNFGGGTVVRIGGYSPTVYEVGPGKTYDPANYDGTETGPIQAAIDASWQAGGTGLVVVYPGQPVSMVNPHGYYLENPVLYAPVKLQGVGPGGTYPDADWEPGSIIDGRAVGGDTPYTTWWRATLIPEIWNNRGGWDRGLMDDPETPTLYEGAVVTVYGEVDEFSTSERERLAIDGFVIQGGDQQGFPNNIDQVLGPLPGVTPNIVVQGGGLYVDSYATGLKISNNIIQSNGGSYGGAIRVGTPNIPEPLKDNHNDHLLIAHNRIIANGGTNLAGAIGLFAGADDYTIEHNDLCGNFSAELGGGISHYGYSPNGTIRFNRIYFNRSFDEGGGIMIAGELPADPTVLTPGAGPVDIYGNQLQSNLANDDGGGLRFLMSGNFEYNVYNNIIVNNISTHEGGGVSLFDAPNVRVFNNTIMKNISTATAMTSNGQPAPAGLSSARNSNLLQATLPPGAPVFSNPLIFNNIFWDNRAGYWNGDGVSGIGLTGDPNQINRWDLGVADGSGDLFPQYSLLQDPNAGGDHNIVGEDPLVVEEYNTSIAVMPWRGNANVVGINLVAVDLPVTLLGDYHLQAGSPAVNMGARSVNLNGVDIFAPVLDYDGHIRADLVDIGADEIPIDPGTVPAGLDLHLIYLPFELFWQE